MPDENSKEGGASDRGFKVTDRRAFAGDGTPRAEGGLAETPREEEARAADAPKLPPIDFVTFVYSLATQAHIHMGDIAPKGEEPITNLPLAQQTVDILALLEEKTRGNLKPEEAALLSELLYQLRMRFVEVCVKKS